MALDGGTCGPLLTWTGIVFVNAAVDQSSRASSNEGLTSSQVACVTVFMKLLRSGSSQSANSTNHRKWSGLQSRSLPSSNHP